VELNSVVLMDNSIVSTTVAGKNVYQQQLGEKRTSKIGYMLLGKRINFDITMLKPKLIRLVKVEEQK
jgi:hypothetical protein